VAATIHADMARNLTIDDVKEKMGANPDSPVDVKNHAAKDVDELLNDVL
jgi:hypothetical protein